MSNPFARRELQRRTVPKRPLLLANSAGLDPAINLCRIPETEDAVEAWLLDTAAIQADLQGLAKALWWSVGAGIVPGGSWFYHEEETGDFGIIPEDLMEEGQYDPLASCRAATRACERASEYEWYVASDIPEFVRSTIARFVTFGRYWRKGLERSAYGRAKHNAWRDACYGTLEPSAELLVDAPVLLGVLEKLETTINSSPEGVDAITPTQLEAAIDKLPANWMVWEDLVCTHDLLQANVLDGNITPFVGNEYYRYPPA